MALSTLQGQVAVLHNRRPVPVRVELPAFTDAMLKSDLVTMVDVPFGMEPDATGCLCFPITDDRFAFVHSFHHAHEMIESYNTFLVAMGKPRLSGVQLKLSRDASIPTTGSASLRDVPKIDMSFPTPAVEVFTLAHEIGHLVDYRIGKRAPTTGDEALEGGVIEGTANILAALWLGTPASPLFTDDSLDAPPANDVDTFIRFPDLVIKRRHVMESLVGAPRFAERYANFAQLIRDNLANPDLATYLDKPDEYASSAVVNQPLWHAAARHGFDVVKRLYLRTLAAWNEPEVSYVTLSRQIVTQAQLVSPELAETLRREYAARGL